MVFGLDITVWHCRFHFSVLFQFKMLDLVIKCMQNNLLDSDGQLLVVFFVVVVVFNVLQRCSFHNLASKWPRSYLNSPSAFLRMLGFLF